MELKFPEYSYSKINANENQIKMLTSKIDEDKPGSVWKHSGPMYDCKGCAASSGMRIGGPCNTCKYKADNRENEKKFKQMSQKI
jgi:hypothetical protein